MDLKQIERLMQTMIRSGIKKLHIKQEGFEIDLSSEGQYMPQQVVHEERPAPVFAHPHSVLHHEEKVAPVVGSGGRFITSPIVGTFYLASSPDHSPFVRVGDTVEEGSVVCIIEAMKVMNEVKAGQKGKITEVLVRNGDPVEFGTKLFKIT